MNHDEDKSGTTSEPIEQGSAIKQPVETEHETESRSEEMKLVPVSEAIRYRKRAQAAEKQVEELKGQLTHVEEHLCETKKQIDDARAEQEVRLALIDADAVDVETARLLVQNMLDENAEGEGNPDIGQIVRTIRERKPFLFRTERSVQDNGSVMGGHLRPQQIHRATPLHHAASEARNSGRRQDLLRYMRLRRAEH